MMTGASRSSRVEVVDHNVLESNFQVMKSGILYSVLIFQFSGENTTKHELLQPESRLEPDSQNTIALKFC